MAVVWFCLVCLEMCGIWKRAGLFSDLSGMVARYCWDGAGMVVLDLVLLLMLVFAECNRGIRVTA